MKAKLPASVEDIETIRSSIVYSRFIKTTSMLFPYAIKEKKEPKVVHTFLISKKIKKN